jgi:hypothetical protein
MEELAPGRLPRRVGRAGRPRLRRLRSGLPRRLRPAAADAPGAGRAGARSATSSPSTATKARAVLEALLQKYADSGIPAWSRWRFSRWTRSQPSAPPWRSSNSSAARGLPRRHPGTWNGAALIMNYESSSLIEPNHHLHKIQIQPFLIHFHHPPLFPSSFILHAQRLQPRQNHPGHHAQGRRHLRRRAAARTARLDVLPQDLRRPRKGDGAPARQLPLAAAQTPALVQLGGRTMEGITGEALLDFVNNTSCPSSRPSTGGATRSPASSAWPSRMPTTT